MDKEDIVKRWYELYTNFNDVRRFFHHYRETGTKEIFDRKLPKFLQLEVSFHNLMEDTERFNDFNSRTPILVENKNYVYEVIDDIRKKYWKAQKVHLEKSPLSDVSILPEIPLSVFDGMIEKWPEFNVSFNTLVHHNYNYSEKHKMQYLKSYICGDAARIVSEFPMTEEYYTRAYDKLKKHYGGLRYRGHYYVDAMLKYKEYHFDSGRYLDVHENAVCNLKTLNLPNLAECILFYISYNNLDKNMQKEFDSKFGSGTSIPTTKHLFDFVRNYETPEEDEDRFEIITLD